MNFTSKILFCISRIEEHLRENERKREFEKYKLIFSKIGVDIFAQKV